MRSRVEERCPHCGGPLSKYGFGRLEVGEQLMLPLVFRDDVPRWKTVARVRNAVFAFAERNNRRFTVTAVNNGALVKRVA